MSEWIRLCSASEAPEPGKLGTFAAGGVDVCVANVDGELAAMDNRCPHRQGPLGEGWIEGTSVVCPWHAWAFDCRTGDCPEEKSHVAVFPLRREGEDVLVDIA